jgi:hypothetical protein
MGQKRRASDLGVRPPVPLFVSLIRGLKTNATQRFLFKIQNLCYTYYSPPVSNATFLQCGGRTSEMVNSDVSRSLKWKEEIFYLDSP